MSDLVFWRTFIASPISKQSLIYFAASQGRHEDDSPYQTFLVEAYVRAQINIRPVYADDDEPVGAPRRPALKW